MLLGSDAIIISVEDAEFLLEVVQMSDMSRLGTHRKACEDTVDKLRSLVREHDDTFNKINHVEE